MKRDPFEVVLRWLLLPLALGVGILGWAAGYLAGELAWGLKRGWEVGRGR